MLIFSGLDSMGDGIIYDFILGTIDPEQSSEMEYTFTYEYR